MSGNRIDHKLARRGGWAELLRLPALLYGAGTQANGYLYTRGLREVLRVAAPVVSVGNLAAGGTGKTPTVAWLARWMIEHGLRPGVVSRGYGAAEQGSATNDEARMLARELPGVLHEQDPNRVRGAQKLVEMGVDAILMDDGFQHRRLARDLDMVLIDAARPWGLPAPGPETEAVCSVLPRGLLRESLGALARADLLMITRVDSVSPACLAKLEKRLAQVAPRVPILHSNHMPVALSHADGELELECLRDLEVDLLSGVGNPEAVHATLESLGAVVVQHLDKPDHHAWTAADLEGLGARPVVTTAKDRPKLEGLASLALWTLEVRLAISRGQDILEDRLRALPMAAATQQRAAFHEGLHG